MVSLKKKKLNQNCECNDDVGCVLFLKQNREFMIYNDLF